MNNKKEIKYFSIQILARLFLLSVLVILFGQGQLLSQSFNSGTLYAFDKYMINGAYAGLTGDKVMSVYIKEQWVGLPNRPKSYMIAYSTPMYRLNGAVGVKIGSYSSGIQNSYNIDLSYNYVYQSRVGLISFGLGSGIRSMNANKNSIITSSGIYNKTEINHNDPFLTDIFQNNSVFYKISGFAIYNYRNFEIGIVFDKELNIVNKLKYNIRDVIRLNWQYLYKLNELITIKTFGIVYSDFVLLQNDIGVVGIINKNYLAGINVRGYNHKTFDSFSIIVGGNLNFKLRLLYSYDFSLSSLQKVEDGSHEVKIIYNFGEKKYKRELPPIIYNPRL